MRTIYRWPLTDASLSTFFAQFGQVSAGPACGRRMTLVVQLSDVYIARSSDTARPRGFGFVTYADPEDAKRVVAMTKLRLDGKQVALLSSLE